MFNFWLSIVLAVCSSFAWVKSGHVRFEFGKMVRLWPWRTGKTKYIGHFYIPRSHTRAFSTHIHAKRRHPKIFLQKCRNIREFQTIFLPSNYKNTDFKLQASPHGTSDTLMIYLAVVCGHGEWYRIFFIWAPLRSQIFTQEQTQNLQGKLKFSSVETAGT